MTMNKRTRSNPKGLNRSITMASATMLGRGVEVDATIAPPWVTAAPTDEADGFDVKDWNGIHVTAVCERTPAATDLYYARIRVWRYYKTHPSRLVDGRAVGRWVQDYDRIYTLNQLSMTEESQHRVYGTRNADKMYLQIVEITAKDAIGNPVSVSKDDILWIHIQPWGLIRKDEPVPFELGSDPALAAIASSLSLGFVRPVPIIDVLHDGSDVAGPDPLSYPATVYFPDAAGMDLRDGAGRERRNFALYLDIQAAGANGAASTVIVTVEEDISPIDVGVPALPHWVNMSAAGYSIINDVRGVIAWTNTTAEATNLVDRVDWDGVRGGRVRIRVDVGSVDDIARLIASRTEEN